MKSFDYHTVETVDWSTFSEPEIRVMRYACICSDESLLEEYADSDEKHALEMLKNRFRLHSDDDKGSAGQPFREYMIQKLNPTLKNCSPLLDRMWNSFDPENKCNLSKYKKMIPVFLQAHVLFTEDNYADCAFRAASIMRICYERLHEALVLAEYAAEIREAHENYKGAAEAYQLLSAIFCDLNQWEEATDSTVHVYELDCFRMEEIDLHSLFEDYFQMGFASKYGTAKPQPFYHAAMYVAAILLYRTLPGLESYLRENNLLATIYVDPKEDKAALPLLLDQTQFFSVDSAFSNLGIEKKLSELSVKEHRHAFSKEHFKTYLHILHYLSVHANDEMEACVLETTDDFLYSFHNFICTLNNNDKLRTWFASIAEIRQALFPDKSRAIEISNIAIQWQNAANRADSIEEKRKALETGWNYALQSLEEADKKAPEETVFALMLLADLSLDILESGQEASKAEEAEKYARRAVEACKHLHSEPPKMASLRLRLHEKGIDLPEHPEPEEADPEAIRKLFCQTDARRDWYLERERKRKMEVLEQYEFELSLWNLLTTYSNNVDCFDQALMSHLTFPNLYGRAQVKAAEDCNWISGQKAQIEAHPGEDLLLPYHIEKYFDSIERNAIRCNSCGEILESSGYQYIDHERKICSCGACGIDGSPSRMLVRFTPSPSKKYYTELSITTKDTDRILAVAAIDALLSQVDEDEIYFDD